MSRHNSFSPMAREELRYDAMPPHLWTRPHTLADLDRNIAGLEALLRSIGFRIQAGKDRAYWEDCRDREDQRLAIYRDARAKLIWDGSAA